MKEVNDASSETIKGYRIVLNQLNKFLKGKPFRETTEDDIFAFISHKKEKGLGPSSLRLYKIYVKSFYRNLYGLPSRQYPDQVRNLNGGNTKRKIPIRPEDVITKEDVASLIKHCLYYRDEAIITVLYESGCRLGEFVNINIGHLKFDKKGIVLVVSGKTDERRIRLIESVVYIQRWLENHPLKDKKDKPLWCSLRKPHQRVTRANIQALLTGLKKRSGFNKPMNAHAFRHSRITEFSKYLTDAKLRVLAGWTASSQMTGVYVHLSGKDLDDDLMRVAGIQIEEEKPKISPLLERECPRRRTKNPVNNTFCGLCGLVLDETKAVTLELDTEERMKNLEEKSQVMETEREVLENVIGEQQGQIDVLKTELSGKYLDAKFFLDEIDELREEIEELKKSKQ